MGREISINQVDSYPKAKARPALPAKGVPGPNQVGGKGMRRAPSLPKDSYEAARPYDADLHQAKELRQRSLTQGKSSAPEAKVKIRVNPDTTRTAAIDLAPDYPTAGGTKNSGPGLETGPKSAPPKPKTKTAPTQNTRGPVDPKTYKYQLALIEAANKKQNANHEASLNKKPQAPKNASAGKISVSKSTVGARGLGTAAGLVSMKQGYDKLRNGQVAEGSFNIAQGGVATASEGRELYYASKGLKAPVSTAGKFLGRANIAFTAGMAGIDSKASYDAYKAGNTVEASERAGSAVINGISAFPPTAVIGAVGSLLDYGMAKSGADKMMVDKWNEGQDKEVKNTSEERQYLGRMLLNTPNENLRGFNQKNRHRLAQGITGLQEMRQECAEQGDTRNVALLDREIRRIRQGLAGN